MVRAVLAAILLALATVTVRAESGCAPMAFDGSPYTVCRFDLRDDRLALYSLDAEGQPYGSFEALRQALDAQGKTLRFAMNAGMFNEALKPIGLYVEDGRLVKKLNRKAGGGNFHLKPNGVFWLKGDQGGVMETEAYARSGIRPDYATQSGPMLVVDGAIHPKFSEDGSSTKRRNGVGMVDANHVVFAISEDWVNFHSFARLFRDGLGCRNALFLDGSVSSLFDAETGRNEGYAALGPIVGLAN